MDLNTTWSINNENGYLSEQLYDSTAFFSLFTLPSLNNSTKNILAVRPKFYNVMFITNCIAKLKK